MNNFQSVTINIHERFQFKMYCLKNVQANNHSSVLFTHKLHSKNIITLSEVATDKEIYQGYKYF